MYRQVLVDPSQTSLQRILWRESPTCEALTYELNTITYGTASASYLATRCLKQLASEYALQFPFGVERLARDFYVDDLLTGADTLDEILVIRDQLISILDQGKFELSKWHSNVPELCGPPASRREEFVEIGEPIDSRILGIVWRPNSDTFHFTFKTEESSNRVTKRAILSEVSRLFDPLGLLGPSLVLAKLIIQDLWQANISWDEAVPLDLNTKWTKLKL